MLKLTFIFPKFQFLIGTLETFVKGDMHHDRYRFQFLIGTLETIFKVLQLLLCFEFQFLIGTLETKTVGISEAMGGRVSIPHRYARNLKW